MQYKGFLVRVENERGQQVTGFDSAEIWQIAQDHMQSGGGFVIALSPDRKMTITPYVHKVSLWNLSVSELTEILRHWKTKRRVTRALTLRSVGMKLSASVPALENPKSSNPET